MVGSTSTMYDNIRCDIYGEKSADESISYTSWGYDRFHTEL